MLIYQSISNYLYGARQLNGSSKACSPWLRQCKTAMQTVPEFLKKIREIVRYFSMDLEATKIAELTNLNRNTINRYVKTIREKIVDFCEKESPFSGEIEVDESYFGTKRVKGKRRRRTSRKIIIFELLKRRGTKKENISILLFVYISTCCIYFTVITRGFLKTFALSSNL